VSGNILAVCPATHPPVMLETLDSQLVHSDHDSDKTDAEKPGNGILETQSSSSSSTVGMSDSPPPPKVESNSSAKEDSDEIHVLHKFGIKEKKRKREIKGNARRCEH